MTEVITPSTAGSATHEADTVDAHDASAISVVPAGNITSTDVQAALQELDGDIAAGGIPATIVDAKGDLIAATAADTVARLAALANGAALITASGETTGLKWRLNNDAASAAPTVNDDSGDGYSIGSRWLDTTAAKEYVALDVTAGAAVWVETTGAGGGSGTTWQQDINESGASFANWTAGTGTWASDGTNISQTSTAGAFQEARFTTAVANGILAIMEAEIRFPTTGAGVGTPRVGGLLLGFDGADATTGYGIRLDESGDLVSLESVATTSIRNIAATINKDVWYKLRAVRGSNYCDVYLDGTLLGTVRMGSVAFDVVSDYVGLYCFGTRVDYRNIKVWTLRGGLPA